jgi:hypothetical protein
VIQNLVHKRWVTNHRTSHDCRVVWLSPTQWEAVLARSIGWLDADDAEAAISVLAGDIRNMGGKCRAGETEYEGEVRALGRPASCDTVTFRHSWICPPRPGSLRNEMNRENLTGTWEQNVPGQEGEREDVMQALNLIGAPGGT